VPVTALQYADHFVELAAPAMTPLSDSDERSITLIVK